MHLLPLVLTIAAVAVDSAPEPQLIRLTSARDTVRVTCPVGAITRIVLPDEKRRLVTVADEANLHIRGLRTSPATEIAVRPAVAGRSVLTFEGANLSLEIEVIAIEAPAAQTPEGLEVRVELPPQAPPVPTPDAPPVNAQVPPEEPVPTPAPAPAHSPEPVAIKLPDDAPPEGATSTTPPGLTDLDDLVAAQPHQIDRRIVVAGHPEMRAEVVHLGKQWTWVRLRLIGSATRQVASITWRRERKTGLAEHWRAEPDGKDLRITVQVPPGERRTDISVQILGGTRYDVPLHRPGLSDLKDRLF